MASARQHADFSREQEEGQQRQGELRLEEHQSQPDACQRVPLPAQRAPGGGEQQEVQGRVLGSAEGAKKGQEGEGQAETLQRPAVHPRQKAP
jgi:hypothetical protein